MQSSMSSFVRVSDVNSYYDEVTCLSFIFIAEGTCK